MNRTIHSTRVEKQALDNRKAAKELRDACRTNRGALLRKRREKRPR